MAGGSRCLWAGAGSNRRPSTFQADLVVSANPQVNRHMPRPEAEFDAMGSPIRSLAGSTARAGRGWTSGTGLRSRPSHSAWCPPNRGKATWE